MESSSQVPNWSAYSGWAGNCNLAGQAGTFENEWVSCSSFSMVSKPVKTSKPNSCLTSLVQSSCNAFLKHSTEMSDMHQRAITDRVELWTERHLFDEIIGKATFCLASKKDQMHSMLKNMFIISLSWDSIKNKSKNFICSPLLSSIRSWNLTIFTPSSAEAGFIMCLWFFENNYFLAGYLLYSLLYLYSFISKRTGIPE